MYTISNFELETVITLENIKEILADMGVKYIPMKRKAHESCPSVYSDGMAYEIKTPAESGLRKGCPTGRVCKRFFLLGKTVQEVLDFLNEAKENTKEEFTNNYIQRPNLKASAHITIDGDKPIVEVTNYRATSMETMRSLDAKRAAYIDRIFCGPKKRGCERRPSNNRVGDNCKPVYNVTTGELSYKAVFHALAKAGNHEYAVELKAVTKSCEYNIPVPEGDKPYSGQQFQWAAEMPMEKLEEILASMKEAKCRTYADYKRKKAKAESKALAASFTQAVNNVNGNLSDSIAMEILAQLKKLNAGMEKLAAMWE